MAVRMAAQGRMPRSFWCRSWNFLLLFPDSLHSQALPASVPVILLLLPLTDMW